MHKIVTKWEPQKNLNTFGGVESSSNSELRRRFFSEEDGEDTSEQKPESLRGVEGDCSDSGMGSRIRGAEKLEKDGSWEIWEISTTSASGVEMASKLGVSTFGEFGTGSFGVTKTGAGAEVSCFSSEL